MNLEPSIPLHSGGKTIPFYSLFGDVEFRNVSFTYPTRPHQVVLDDLSLKIPAGHMVALVGSRYVIFQNSIGLLHEEDSLLSVSAICKLASDNSDQFCTRTFSCVSVAGVNRLLPPYSRDSTIARPAVSTWTESTSRNSTQSGSEENASDI